MWCVSSLRCVAERLGDGREWQCCHEAVSWRGGTCDSDAECDVVSWWSPTYIYWQHHSPGMTIVTVQVCLWLQSRCVSSPYRYDSNHSSGMSLITVQVCSWLQSRYVSEYSPGMPLITIQVCQVCLASQFRYAFDYSPGLLGMYLITDQICLWIQSRYVSHYSPCMFLNTVQVCLWSQSRYFSEYGTVQVCLWSWFRYVSHHGPGMSLNTVQVCLWIPSRYSQSSSLSSSTCMLLACWSWWCSNWLLLVLALTTGWGVAVQQLQTWIVVREYLFTMTNCWRKHPS